MNRNEWFNQQPLWFRIKFYAKFWLLTLPYARTIYKWNELKQRYHKPKLKAGDRVKLDISYAVVAYRVDAIKKHKSGAHFYRLIGEEILSHDGKNPHMTEAKLYEPWCEYVDKKGTKL